MTELQLENLSIKVGEKIIFKNLNLKIKPGEIHVIMGPNGAGKSTLGNAIMGHPNYEAFEGKILLDGTNICELAPEDRAKQGLFLSFQHPLEIAGVTLSNFLRTAFNEHKPKEEKLSVFKFQELLSKKMNELKIPQEFASRYLNYGFSGGEKKRCELLQLAILEPKIAILDEIDSGLDIDALKIVAENISKISTSKKTSFVIITHHKTILSHLKPDFIHIFMNGKIVKSAGAELAEEIESKGYSAFNPLKLEVVE